MTYDMLIRKKVLKIQERLGMRIGIAFGTQKKPLIKNPKDALDTLRDLYRIGIKAFLFPHEMFSNIKTTTDLYKVNYGNLLSIRDLAKKYNIELSINHSNLPPEPDQTLKTFCNIASVMDCRIFTINPSFYSSIMPQDQALRLSVYKINEIVNNMRGSCKIGIETTGKTNEVGSLEDVIDIVKRTTSTEPVINWGNIHGRGSGALRDQKDYGQVISQVKTAVGPNWFRDAYFIFSGVSYGPSGKIKNIPLENADIKLEYMIKEIMSYNIKGTLIFDDPGKDKFILNMIDKLADMVR